MGSGQYNYKALRTKRARRRVLFWHEQHAVDAEIAGGNCMNIVEIKFIFRTPYMYIEILSYSAAPAYFFAILVLVFVL